MLQDQEMRLSLNRGYRGSKCQTEMTQSDALKDRKYLRLATPRFPTNRGVVRLPGAEGSPSSVLGTAAQGGSESRPQSEKQPDDQSYEIRTTTSTTAQENSGQEGSVLPELDGADERPGFPSNRPQLVQAIDDLVGQNATKEAASAIGRLAAIMRKLDDNNFSEAYY